MGAGWFNEPNFTFELFEVVIQRVQCVSLRRTISW